MGALIGAGGAKLLNTAETRRMSRLLEDAKRPAFDVATDVLHQELRDISLSPPSLSAAGLPVSTIDDLSIAGKAASGAAKATAKLNPLLRTLQSPSRTVRDVASKLMDAPVYLKKNMRGEGDTAAETAMHEYARGAVVQALEAQQKAFMALRSRGVVMTNSDFREAIGKAMRRADTSDIPEVAQAAAAWRSKVIEPLKERAVALKMLPADVHVNTAASYFSRLYNVPKIEANEQEFRTVVRDWLSGALDQEIRRANAKADAKILELNTRANELQAGILRRGENLKRQEQGLTVDPELNESDVVDFVRRHEKGERPAKVQSLSEWLRTQRKDGIFDATGELSVVFPDAKNIPGLLRKTRKSRMSPRGGLGLDDIIQRAWDEGFFNEAGTVRMGANSGRDTLSERPTIREFLDALDNDARGDRVVRVGDEEALRAADDFERVVQALDRAGVDFDRPRFATSEALDDLVGKVNRALDDLDREKVATLNAHAAEHLRRKPTDFVSDADRSSYLDELVEDIYAKVTGRLHDGDVPTNITVAARGPLKERTFNIPDAAIEKFLDSDAEFIGRRYARIMAADIELTDRFGSPDMADALAEIKRDYAALREKVLLNDKIDSAGRTKALENLSAREKADIRDISGVRDLLRGHYRPEIQHTTWARIGRAANTFNYIRALGGVLVASLTDAVRPAMVHGLTAYMRDGLGPLIRNTAAVKMSRQEAKLAGAISEKWLASRLATMAEITDPYSIRSPFEKFLDNAGAGFSKMTGILHWNDFQKGIAATMTQNRILKNAEVAASKGFDALPKAEQAYMGFLGIGQGRAEDLGKLFASHGETLDGVRVANSDAWGDGLAEAGLRRAYRAAINKDVDSIIVTKGVGDVPLLLNTPIGKALLQFKSFAIASNQRVLIRGLQEDTTRFVGGTVGMATIGMFIYWLKQMESDRPVSDNPGNWIAEGIDRSGIFSVGLEINNAIEKVGGPGVFSAAASLFPEKTQRAPASRYAVRSKVGGFLGPSFGGATDVVGLMSLAFQNAGLLATGEAPAMTPGDVQSVRRLTPFASLPYWRWLIDGMVVPELKEGLAK